MGHMNNPRETNVYLSESVESHPCNGGRVLNSRNRSELPCDGGHYSVHLETLPRQPGLPRNRRHVARITNSQS